MSLLARQLRRAFTQPERLLCRLRNRQLQGAKFRRQHPVAPYVVDFVCLEAGLVVELDGRQHLLRKTYVAERTRMLKSKGLTVIRFRNVDVYRRRNEVVQAIDFALTLPLRPRAGGEGRGEVG
ncbi:MAG TPA: endonuclease domain-containing protein [Burkholderiales bacterium]|nr:endonuclease domain-containing protein [Burkholderiales bacterium]